MLFPTFKPLAMGRMWLLWYCLLPVVSACVWLAMLMGMLIRWRVEGSPHYSSMAQSQSIAYISDIGAQKLKPLFVTGSIITTILLNAAFLSERWLRHKGQLSQNQGRAGKSMSISSIVFAFCGAAGLILLSIFDTMRHPTMHNVFLMMFIAGYLLSAIFICVAYQRLGIYYPEHRILQLSFKIKLVFILAELALAIAFVAHMHSAWRNVAAVLEWVIAFSFALYILSFVIDLLPVVRSANDVPRDAYVLEMSICTSTGGRQERSSSERP